MDFSFFLTDNKSGYKTRSEWVRKNNPELHNKIMSFNKEHGYDDTITFKQQLWNYFHDVKIHPTCLNCGVEVKFYERFDRGYRDFCSLECANKQPGILLERGKKTMLENHGVEFYPHHPEFIPKRKKTKLERYGDEEYVNVPKAKETKLKKYGDEKYINVEKIKKTNMIKYGVDNPSKLIEKIRVTNNLRYGYDTANQKKEVKDKLYNTILNKIKTKFKEGELISYTFVDKQYRIKCLTCGDEYEIHGGDFNHKRSRNIETCPICNPNVGITTSIGEQEIGNFISENYKNGEILLNDRTMLKSKELDIFLPNEKIGVEYNGVYWHSNIWKENNYHLEKTEECERLNIKLIHIFEDEWENQKDVIKTYISNRIGTSINKICTKDCDVRKVSIEDSQEFLIENHILGGEKRITYSVGLYHNDILVYIMCFTKHKHGWSLTKFCDKIAYHVKDGEKVLLNHFINDIKPTIIKTISEIRFGDDFIYEGMGFVKKGVLRPNFWYVYNDLRLTEDQLLNYISQNPQLFDVGVTKKYFNKIYDCGNIKWEWIPENI